MRVRLQQVHAIKSLVIDMQFLTGFPASQSEQDEEPPPSMPAKVRGTPFWFRRCLEEGGHRNTASLICRLHRRERYLEK